MDIRCIILIICYTFLLTSCATIPNKPPTAQNKNISWQHRVQILSSIQNWDIKATIAIPFARPRQTYELKRDPLFGELTYTIWEALRDEVNAARAAEIR